MANWKPANGEKVHWHMPGGEILPETTTFTDTNPPIISTVQGFAARYANGKIPERSGVRAHLWGQGDENGILSAAMERAGKDPKNKWGLSASDFNNPVIVQDFGATQIGPEGLAKSEIMKLYPATGAVGDWPVREGDSTNPNNRTARKIRGPYGNFEKTVGGITYYYKNTRPNQPDDPWYISPTESKPWDGNKVIASPTTTTQPTMPSAPTTAPVVDTQASPDVKTQVGLIVATYSRDLPPEGEGGRYANKLRQMIKELRGLIG